MQEILWARTRAPIARSWLWGNGVLEFHRDEAMSALRTPYNLIRCHAGAFAPGGVMACAAAVANGRGGCAPAQVWGCCGMKL